jgi:hypothetical protein
MSRFMLFCTIGLFLCAAGVIAQPKIEVSTGPTLDMGDVYSGQKAERITFVKNVGNDTLLITEVKAQCGCTATFMTEKKLAPKDSGKLSISFNTNGVNGKASKEVYVSSNDPSNPKVTIRFSANVLNVLDVTPKMLAFDQAKVDSSYTKVITVSNPSAKDAVKILSVTSKFEQLEVSLMKNQLMPGEQTQLQAVLKPLKSGTLNGTIEVMTDNPNQPKYEIRVVAFVNRK